MTSYTEEEIRKAWEYPQLSGFSSGYIEVMIRALQHIRKKDHVYDFTDDDTITVREIRETWKKWYSVPYHEHSIDAFLQDISEHRENFGEKSVVQDPEGNIWKLRRGSWLIFGSGMTVGYDIPRRPLKLLGTDARRD